MKIKLFVLRKLFYPSQKCKSESLSATQVSLVGKATHSFIHSFIHSFNHSFIHSFIHYDDLYSASSSARGGTAKISEVGRTKTQDIHRDQGTNTRSRQPRRTGRRPT